MEFIKHHKILLAFFVVFAIMGMTLIIFNTWQYNVRVNTVEIIYGDQTKTVLLMNQKNSANIKFITQNPNKIDHLVIEMQCRETNATLVSMELNGVLIREIQNPVANQVDSITLEKGLVLLNNELVLNSNGRVTLQYLRIKQYYYARKVSYLLLNLLGALIMVGPIFLWRYFEFLKKEAYEDRFPDFLRDVVGGLKAGMSLTQAVTATKKMDYGKLTPHIKKIIAKLDWGLSFEKALEGFAEKSGSKTIKRSIRAIIQTYNSGGKISNVLNSIGENLKELRKLKKERQTELYGEVLTGYIVYFAFIIVLIGLMRYLVPTLNLSGDVFSLQPGGGTAKSFISLYRVMFRNLIVIQSIFSGLVIGKLSEGKLTAGFKHMAILLILGYTAAVLLI